MRAIPSSDLRPVANAVSFGKRIAKRGEVTYEEGAKEETREVEK